MNKIINYFKESKEELSKVNWPTKNQTINYTIIVVVVSISVAVFLGLLDLGFSRVVETFIF